MWCVCSTTFLYCRTMSVTLPGTLEILDDVLNSFSSTPMLFPRQNSCSCNKTAQVITLSNVLTNRQWCSFSWAGRWPSDAVSNQLGQRIHTGHQMDFWCICLSAWAQGSCFSIVLHCTVLPIVRNILQVLIILLGFIWRWNKADYVSTEAQVVCGTWAICVALNTERSKVRDRQQEGLLTGPFAPCWAMIVRMWW